MKSSPDDRELMAEVAAGSLGAFGRLYDRFGKRAYEVAHAVCGDEARTQDAMQIAFQAVWVERASYSPERGTVAGWLLTIVRHHATDLATQHGARVADTAADDRLSKASAGGAARLRASLARLPDEQQEVIVLAYYGQLSHNEIATRLDLPPGIVKGRMRLGLHKLQRHMDQAVV